MAKAIKRVGVIFLAVAIICLMAIGVILGVNNAKSETASSLNLNNEIENNLQIAVDKSYTLSGTNAQMAETWNEAVKYSRDNGGVNVNVTLNANWTAQSNSEYTTSFGEGVGFGKGRVYVPTGTTITLDLNGKTINRNLSSAIAYGNVMVNQGNLNIIDSSSSKIGTIKGGYLSGDSTDINGISGGGIFNYGKLTLSSGNISENIAFNSGGGVHNNGTFIMNGGKISKNQTIGIERGSNGGGVTNAGIFILYDGEISENYCIYTGGGLYTNAIFEMYGGKITNNSAGDHGGGLRVSTTQAFFAGGIITGNKARRHAGLVLYGAIMKISAGLQIYGNYITDEPSQQSDFDIKMQTNVIQIVGKLADKGKTTRIGLGGPWFNNVMTSGYSTYNSGIDPSRYFFSNFSNGKIALNESGEVIITAGTPSVSKLTWSWSGAGTGSTTESNAVVPYTGSSYRISVSSGTIKNSDGSNNVSVSAPGTYAFYVDGDYLNPTFMFTIEGGIITPPSKGNNTITYNGSSFTYDLTNFGFDSEKMFIYNNVETEPGIYYATVGPKTGYKWADGTKTILQYEFVIEHIKVEVPTAGNNVLVYNGSQMEYSLTIDDSIVEIVDNQVKDIGKYTAKLKLKDTNHYRWKDGSTEDKEYPFEIIHPGVVLKDNSNFDYIYKDSNNLRQSYKDNKIIHKVSENETTSNYVIGNIAPKTTIKQFVGDIRKECGYIKIYNGNTMLYDGTTEIEASDSIYVATGYRLELYKNSNGTELLDTVYLSVLGDVVADGVINTLDITYINRIAKGEIKLETLSIEQQLAAMVDNKGKVTSTDGKILLNVIGGNTEVDNYFENVSQEDKYQILVLNNTNGKTYRQNMNLTTLNVYDNAIIGNIATKTKVNEFKTKLANQTSANISDIAIYKANGAIAGDNDYIGTGYYISYAGKTIYLSVLGDLTGDGEVNTMDVTYLNRIISGNVKLNTNDIKDKLIMLSALIQNKGNLTTADSETLLNYIGGNAEMTKYF